MQAIKLQRCTIPLLQLIYSIVQLCERYELKNGINSCLKDPIQASQALPTLQQGSLLCVVLFLAAASSIVTILLSKDDTVHDLKVKHKNRLLPYIYGFYAPALVLYLALQKTLLKSYEHYMYNQKVAEVCGDYEMSVISYCQNSTAYGIALLVLSIIYNLKHAENRWLFRDAKYD